MSASNPPIRRNLTIYQGATFDDSAVWKAGETKASVQPVDLTGCTARMQIREKIDSPTPLLELTTENGRIVLGGVTGEIAFSLDPVLTAALTWRSGVYDLEIVYPDGAVRRLFSGAVTVSREVTRAGATS